MYCTSCRGVRRHFQSEDSGRSYEFCKRCRKNGSEWQRYCIRCGVSLDEPSRGCFLRGYRNHPVPDEEGNEEQYYDDDQIADDGNNDFEDDMGTTAVSDGEPTKGHSDDSRTCGVSSRWTRTLCERCRAAFDLQEEHDKHVRDNEYVCEEYKVSLSLKGIWDHVKAESHDRCFLQGCEFKYRKSAGWRDEVIEEHIWREHLKNK